MNDETVSADQDRRRFYRIDDRVALRYRVVPESELEETVSRLGVGFPDRMSLASAFATTSAQMKQSLERVRRDTPDVATFLEGLNDKLDLLIQLLAASESELGDAPTHQVSLSASGVSFAVDREVPADATLELKMLIFPAYVCIQCYAKVVRCRAESDGSGHTLYRVAADFSHIRENDRELIVRHVTQRQSALLREARMALEDESLLP